MSRAYQSRPDLCRRTVEDLIRRNRVLLAVYWLSDAEGLLCEATNAALSRASGVSFESVKGHLHALVRAGILWSAANSHRSETRVFVLRDHPGAAPTIAALKRSGRYRFCSDDRR